MIGTVGEIRAESTACGLLEELELRMAELSPPKPLLAEVRRFHRANVAALDAEERRRADLLLGRAALRAGAYREAVRALETSIHDDVRETSAEVWRDMARAYNLVGDTARSVEFLRRCVATAERAGNDELRFQMSTYLAVALTDLGDLIGAHGLLEEMRPYASTATAELRIRFYWGEAYLAAAGGQHLLALVRIRRAIQLIEAVDERHWLARAHLYAGEHAFAAGHPKVALGHFEAAGALLAGSEDSIDLVILLCEVGRVAAAAGRGAEAIASARSALARLGNDEPSEQGRARWVLALGLAAQNDHAAALEQFRKADAALSPVMRYTVRLRRDWARSLVATGRHKEAAELLARAVALERIRSLPNPTEALLDDLEDDQAAQRARLAASELRLADLEARVASAEHVLDVAAPHPRPQLRLVPPVEGVPDRGGRTRPAARPT